CLTFPFMCSSKHLKIVLDGLRVKLFKTEKDQNPRIEWKKKGKGVTFVYFNHKFTGSYAGRAKIEGATLTIHSVTQKDSGEYRCEVTASEDHVNLGEATVTLNVLVPPHVPSCNVPSSVFVGSGLELLCKDKLSVPPATYRWYKDNKALTDPKTQLLFLSCTLPPASVCLEQKFKSVSKVDAGMYRCESSNSVGAPKSCVAQQLKCSTGCICSYHQRPQACGYRMPLSIICLRTVALLSFSLCAFCSPHCDAHKLKP
uniref:Junctional adhesion molecule 2b n=1 Tax=Neolamprologus brichardi TaxID=32507 RepID=A0A3Q4G9I6_NEOBR